jgi:parallel beta-helix repeat protein
MKNSWIVAVIGIAILAMGLVVFAGATVEAGVTPLTNTPTNVLVVSSAADSGPNTLRQAMDDAVSGDTITFDTGIFPPGNPATIYVTSQLPDLAGNVTIDASNAGAIVDGSATPPGEDGFYITSSGNTIQGLQIYGFGGDGVVLKDGAQNNTIGGDRSVGAGPCGQGNVISGNSHGVRIEGSGTTSNTIVGNYIGTDPSGSVAIPSNDPSGRGVFIDGAPNNTIGGTTPSESNVIAGGIHIYDIGADGNVVIGNYIGLAPDGASALGGGWNGVGISDGAAYNRIGGPTAAERNVISGNDNAGVHLWGSAHDNRIAGNYIGTDASGTAAVPNQYDGIGITGGSTLNSVGGSNPGEGNLISGNGQYGVRIRDTGTTNNTVSGNAIGTDVTGTAALANGSGGVSIADGAEYNTIGGATSAARNLISGNGEEGPPPPRPGVWIWGAHHNSVLGNYIGTDVTGSASLPNKPGVVVAGNDNDVAHNLISGNAWGGVWAGDGSVPGVTGNKVRGNRIGTDAPGLASLGNDGMGISIWYGATHTVVGGSNATPGGTCSGDCNVISGNAARGIQIEGSGTVSNTVSGNYIGTDVHGTAALGNGTTPGSNGWGIRIDGAPGNTIGGLTAGERNLISGNGDLFCTAPENDPRAEGGGILIFNGADGNVVQGNYVGTDVQGTAALPNGLTGIEIENATGNLIGGPSEGARNVISGNSCGGPPPPRAGIRLMGGGNTVQNNYIGPDATGTAAFPDHGNGDFGMWVISWHNVIQDNVISGNRGDGINVDGNHNTIIGNRIGTAANGLTPLGNGLQGIAFVGDGSDNLVGGAGAGEGNLIAYNDGAGVQTHAACIQNTVSHNSIHTNGGLGIDNVDGGNIQLPAPVILAYDLAAGTASGTACAHCTVELFSDEHGEGHWFEGSTTAGAGGDWSLSKGSAFTGPELTATATDAAGNTSEFGQDWPAEPPPPPLIAAPVCGVTNRPQPRFAGVAQMGSSVRVGSAGLALGDTTTDDWNHWQLAAWQTLADATHVVTATATTVWGTSTEAELDLTVNSALCYDPVGVTFAQHEVIQHPRDADGCVDPDHALGLSLWPDTPVTVSAPVDVPAATVYVEVNSVRYDLSDPDADGLFTGGFTTPGSGSPAVLLVVDCGAGPQTMQADATIDPDGYVYDAALAASTGVTQTIPGVTVTLSVSDTVRHRWVLWSAPLYGQANPQITAEDGFFAFFAPAGQYRLLADGGSVGYELYESPALAVIDEPIRYNVPLWPRKELIYLPLVMRAP